MTIANSCQINDKANYANVRSHVLGSELEPLDNVCEYRPYSLGRAQRSIFFSGQCKPAGSSDTQLRAESHEHGSGIAGLKKKGVSRQ